MRQIVYTISTMALAIILTVYARQSVEFHASEESAWSMERKLDEEIMLVNMLSESEDIASIVDINRMLADIRIEIAKYEGANQNIILLGEPLQDVQERTGGIIEGFVARFNESISIAGIFLINTLIFLSGAVVPLSMISVSGFVAYVIFNRIKNLYS